jgi:23S rRNA (cytosine1962-C5)-methyltransferase
VFEKRRELAATDIDAIRTALAQQLAVPPAQVVVKHRRRQRGSSQYERLDGDAPSFTIRERDLFFEVNLTRYLDTGLFLDHRDTRQLIGSEAQDKRFLNLFAYTGSFTVYAAAGGARQSVTVDMSRTYQQWSQRNLAHNGLADEQRHRFVQSDVMAFLERMRAARAQFDLIMLDPPSFSNSKRMQDAFDVQRDQFDLIRATLGLLAPGGKLYFSNNRRGFRLDERIEQLAGIDEISNRTLPADFKRHVPHRCWLITQG